MGFLPHMVHSAYYYSYLGEENHNLARDYWDRVMLFRDQRNKFESDQEEE
eukprot:JP444334.1.p4 GENE.JP444334.1~~JP444334.1.p4  ORF type:complete len:50 (-),score=9.22 JP444334.1:91-240(-)